MNDREGDPKGWSTVLITVLGSWEKILTILKILSPAAIIN
jgi:hypothetical protein